MCNNDNVSWLGICALSVCIFLGGLGCSDDSGGGYGEEIVSPSGNYSVSVSRNDDKIDKTKYLCLRIHLNNSTGTEVDVRQTNASDTMKWAIGWMKEEDVLVLYSSDIGTDGYRITTDQQLEKLKINQSILERGEELYKRKYK